MTISREKCLEWAEEYPHRYSTYCVDLPALINRAYAEGQKDMLDRAAKLCDQLSYRFVSDEIRALEVE